MQKAIVAGADVNALDSEGQTMLMCAVSNNPNPEVTSLLIKAGADVNAQTEDGSTALMAALTHADPEVLSLLLKAGANPSVKDKEDPHKGSTIELICVQ